MLRLRGGIKVAEVRALSDCQFLVKAVAEAGIVMTNGARSRDASARASIRATWSITAMAASNATKKFEKRTALQADA